MQAIIDRLSEFTFFKTLEPAALEHIAAHGVWHSLAGGWELFAQGDSTEALHFVLSGRLIVVRQSGEGEDEVLGYVRAGEPVGEMSMLSEEAHTASVFALRDTEILSLPRAHVEALLHDHGDFASALARVILARSRHPRESFQQAAPRVFALIGSSPSIDVEARTKDLAKRIARCGLRVTWMPTSEHAPQARQFDEIEENHAILLLPARVDGGPWYRFVLRHADRFLVLARRDARPSRPFPLALEAGERARKFRLVDLVMLHEGAPSSSVAEWADAIGAARVINCRGAVCLDRLARIIAGKSVGLVLSGGGARAYAHIGVIKALREAGVPIDFISGASMGGIVAACVAMGWSDEEIEARIRDAFVESNPLGDHVLPVVALTKGVRVETRLLKHFGDMLIEDLVLPFYCVSSDLVEGVPRVHRRGLLRAALRASIALPGIMPPVVDGDALLVDGAVTNNFPTDVMATMHRGVTIGIDVARRGTIDIEAFRDPPGFISWIARHGVGEAPPIVSLLMRTATARHEQTHENYPPDILITPRAPGVELRDWGLYDKAVASGYEAAKAAIEEHWRVLKDIAEASTS